MSKVKGTIAIAILIISWFAMLWLTGSRTPWQIFSTADKGEGISVYLGDIPSENYDRMGFTKGLVEYIASENSWLVGTDRGELFLFDNDGKQVWKRSLGIGKLVSLCVSHDEKIAFVGEQSPAGNLYAVDLYGGDILWKFAAETVVGVEPAKRSYPSIVHICVDKEDNVYANAYRFVTAKDGSRGYNGKAVAFTKKGEPLWQFPHNENIDSWINWCDVNDNNGKVVLSTSAYEIRPDMKYRDTMYFIDKVTGRLLNSVDVPPVPPFENTVMRGSPNFSADGAFLAAACSDGRGLLFDSNGKILWQRELSKPTQVDEAWINASGRDGFAVKEGVIFTTINTFNRENWQLPTPVEHPSNNSFYVFNYDGTFKYKYKALGTMEQIVFAGDLAACAVGRNVRTHNYAAHGAVIIDLQSGKELSFFHTEGPLQAVAISNDGTSLAGIEAPAVTPEGKIIGAYKLHIWQR